MSIAAYIFKTLLLTVLLALCFVAASTAAGLGQFSGNPENPRDVVGPLLLMSLLYSVVMSYPIIRSRWSGWRLMAAAAFVYFGITTVLTQSETVVFLNQLVDIVPSEMVPILVLQGAIVALVFPPLAVLIYGKARGKGEYRLSRGSGTAMPPVEWIWRLTLVAIVYVAIYFLFGMFVFKPLAGAAFEEYYRGLQPQAWLLPFQAGRAMIWVLVALPVIRMMKGAWWEAGLAVALLFSVLMGVQLILPNDFMPETIRQAHLIELTTSNFAFGWVVAWLFRRRDGLVRGV